MIRDFLDDVDLRSSLIETCEKCAHAANHFAARVGLDVEKALDAIDLIRAQSNAADRVARLVLVSVHQLARDFVETDFVELVEDAKNVDALNLIDRGKIKQQIQHRAAGETDQVASDVQLGQRVAHAGDDFRVGHFRLGADGVEIKLRELAEAALVRLVGTPDGRDLITAEGTRQ